MFLLSSLTRLKAGLGVVKAAEDVSINGLLASASLRIPRHLRREDSLQLTSRTEYPTVTQGQRSFPLRAYPVSSITSVKVDGTGLYTGSEQTLASTDYMLDADGRTLVLGSNWFQGTNNNGWTLPVGPKCLQVVYTGGLATTPVISSWTKSGGTFTVGYYLQGGTSGAIGKITATAAGTVSYHSLSGIFEAGETVTEYTTYSNEFQDGGLSTASGQTATLTAATTVALVESYPDLAMAVQWLVDFWRKNQYGFDMTQIQADGGQRGSNSDLAVDVFSVPAIRDLLDRFVDKTVFP